MTFVGFASLTWFGALALAYGSHAPTLPLTLSGLDAPGAGSMSAAAAAAADAIAAARDVGDGGADADIGTTPPPQRGRGGDVVGSGNRIRSEDRSRGKGGDRPLG